MRQVKLSFKIPNDTTAEDWLDDLYKAGISEPLGIGNPGVIAIELYIDENDEIEIDIIAKRIRSVLPDADIARIITYEDDKERLIRIAEGKLNPATSVKTFMTHDGSNNIFEALGFENAEEMLVKSRMAHDVEKFIRLRNITATEAAVLLEASQSEILSLMDGHIATVSVERLFAMVKLIGSNAD